MLLALAGLFLLALGLFLLLALAGFFLLALGLFLLTGAGLLHLPLAGFFLLALGLFLLAGAGFLHLPLTSFFLLALGLFLLTGAGFFHLPLAGFFLLGFEGFLLTSAGFFRLALAGFFLLRFEGFLLPFTSFSKSLLALGFGLLFALLVQGLGLAGTGFFLLGLEGFLLLFTRGIGRLLALGSSLLFLLLRARSSLLVAVLFGLSLGRRLALPLFFQSALELGCGLLFLLLSDHRRLPFSFLFGLGLQGSLLALPGFCEGCLALGFGLCRVRGDAGRRLLCDGCGSGLAVGTSGAVRALGAGRSLVRVHAGTRSGNAGLDCGWLGNRLTGHGTGLWLGCAGSGGRTCGTIRTLGSSRDFIWFCAGLDGGWRGLTRDGTGLRLGCAGSGGRTCGTIRTLGSSRDFIWFCAGRDGGWRGLTRDGTGLRLGCVGLAAGTRGLARAGRYVARFGGWLDCGWRDRWHGCGLAGDGTGLRLGCVGLAAGTRGLARTGWNVTRFGAGLDCGRRNRLRGLRLAGDGAGLRLAVGALGPICWEIRAGRGCGSFTSRSLAGKGGGFALVGFEFLGAAPVEGFAATESGDFRLRANLFFVAVTPELAGDFGVERGRSVDGNVLELFADAGGAEGGVPAGADLRGGEMELVGIHARAHRHDVAARPLVAIKVETIVRQRTAAVVTEVSVVGAADEHAVVTAAKIGDINGLPMAVGVFG